MRAITINGCSFFIKIFKKTRMYKVKIIDEIMGSGKTYKAIQNMIKHNGNFLYITPFIDEVNRVISSVPSTFQPKITTNYDTQGNKYTKFKRDNLLTMANDELNIVTTHQLFKRLHRNDYVNFLSYDLILDEVLTPIELIGMTKDDIELAIRDGLLVVNPNTYHVTFTGDEYKGEFYNQLKRYCDTSNVIYIDGKLLVWAFPPEIFKSFKSVTVLTYLFEGSLLSSYFEYYNIEYEVKKESIENEIDIKQQIKGLLNIYEGPANDIGNYNTSFSVNWLSNRKIDELKKISTSVSGLLKRNFKTKSIDNAYTTFKDYQNKLSGKGYTKGFIAINSRATNEYADKKSMVYLGNRFLNPNIKRFYGSGAVIVDEEQWALSELLQWIWRGCIRKNQPMNLFIPSKRMRNLLNNWLNSSSIDTKIAA